MLESAAPIIASYKGEWKWRVRRKKREKKVERLTENLLMDYGV
jgi:hypothetical protein